MPVVQIIYENQLGNNIQLLSSGLAKIRHLKQLLQHPKAAIDKIIIAKAISENMAAIAVDLVFSDYDVKVFC